MRFDLEFNIVSQLSYDGLSKLADMFYGEGNDLTPASWDTKQFNGEALATKSTIGLDNYKNLKNIPGWMYASGVSDSTDLGLSSLIIRNNMVCPIFNAGSAFFNKYEFEWSGNSIRKQFEYDDTLGCYKCEVDSDIDTESISVFTLRYRYPGYVTYEREWTFNGEDGYVATLVEENDKFYIHLSGDKIEKSSFEIGTAFAQKGSIISLGEYPIDESSFSIDNFDSSVGEYSLFNNTVAIKNITNDDFAVKVNYEVLPIISYRQTSRDEDSPVFAHANIIPGAVRFNNGLVALNNIGYAGSTIQTDEGANIIVPDSIDLSVSKTTSATLDSVACTAKLTSFGGVPVKNANVKFEITSEDHDTIWLESGSESFTGKTSIDGTVRANAFINKNRFGWYLQKQWVSGNKITVPFDIKTSDTDEVYLYFITSDDAVMGKLFSEKVEVALDEYYTSPKTLETYEVNGRKIAYVKMSSRDEGASQVVYSSFVKPTSITRNQSANTRIKDLYIKNSKQALSSFFDNMEDTISIPLSTPVTSYDALSKGYSDGIIPNNTLDYYAAKITNATVIEFEDAIPNHDNIVGFWLITGSSSGATVKATFEDTNSYIKLESEEIPITTTSYIKSEYEFILDDNVDGSVNNSMLSFGYYTVSEYLENPYKINSCTYTCRYSDAVRKQCIYSNGVYSDYYENDGSSGICIKPSQNDQIDPSSRCPIKSKYITNSDGSPTIQTENIDGNEVDMYEWKTMAMLVQYGKDPHLALIDGDITQEEFDTMLGDGDILPNYKENTYYVENAWGFVNPFIMIAE